MGFRHWQKKSDDLRLCRATCQNLQNSDDLRKCRATCQNWQKIGRFKTMSRHLSNNTIQLIVFVLYCFFFLLLLGRQSAVYSVVSWVFGSIVFYCFVFFSVLLGRQSAVLHILDIIMFFAWWIRLTLRTTCPCVALAYGGPRSWHIFFQKFDR